VLRLQDKRRPVGGNTKDSHFASPHADCTPDRPVEHDRHKLSAGATRLGRFGNYLAARGDGKGDKMAERLEKR
jgi:hypothetical protein